MQKARVAITIYNRRIETRSSEEAEHSSKLIGVQQAMKRRDFVSASAASAAWLAASSLASSQSASSGAAESNSTASSARQVATQIMRVSSPGTMRGEMLYRSLGETGEQVSVIGLGGSHLGQAQVPEDLAINLIHEALDRGINFLDNSWDYNEGRSETLGAKLCLSRAIARRRSS
jgi:hypothetical protein